MAADSQVLKRQREEVEEGKETLTLTLEAEQQHHHQQQQTTLNIKRQKSSSSSTSSSSCNETPSILVEDQEEKLTQQDLSSLISTLQQEPLAPSDNSPLNPLTSSATSELESDVGSAASDEEVEDRERVLRHLLEASDDELGLPSRDDGTSGSSIASESSLFSVNGGDDMENLSWANSTFFDGFWELEDEAANYYTLLQSELFMERDEHGANY